MNALKFFFLYGSLLIFFSCAKQHSYECQISKTASADSMYGPLPVENAMDVYLPGGSNAAKAVILMHGGSWTHGDKEQISCRIISELISMGYAVFNINYRLATEGVNTYPAALEDIQRVMDTLNARAAQYHIVPHQFALLGVSAGAHLALLYSYGFNEAKEVKTVIELSGPVDLTDNAVRGNTIGIYATEFMGIPYANAPDLWKEASPYWQLTAGTGIPTMIIQGEKDVLVPAYEAYLLDKKLTALNIPHQLQLYPEDDHSLGDPFTQNDYLQKMSNWLSRYY